MPLAESYPQIFLEFITASERFVHFSRATPVTTAERRPKSPQSFDASEYSLVCQPI